MIIQEQRKAVLKLFIGYVTMSVFQWIFTEQFTLISNVSIFSFSSHNTFPLLTR